MKKLLLLIFFTSLAIAANRLPPSVAWYVCPYLIGNDASGDFRYCAMDDYTLQVDDWDEAEITGDSAIVKVKADASIITMLDGEFIRIEGRLNSFYRPRIIQAHKKFEDIKFRNNNPAQASFFSLFMRPSFPTTPLLDDFNRGNEGPPPSASWTDITNGLKVISNVIGGDQAGQNTSYWNVETFSTNVESFIDVTTKTDLVGHWAGINWQGVGATATFDGYIISMQSLSGTDAWKFFRILNGTPTQLGATITRELTAGDQIGIRRTDNDSILEAFHNGTSIGTRSDATYTSGNIGANVAATAARSDNFGGGRMVRRIF